MALFSPSALVGSIRGTVGAVTFSRNRAGNVIRSNTTQVTHAGSRTPFPDMEFQRPHAYRRAHHTVLINHWSHLLSQGERDAWDALGADTALVNALAQPYHGSGFSFFLRTNHLRMTTGQSIIDAAPVNAHTQLPLPVLQWNAVFKFFYIQFQYDYSAPGDKVPWWVSSHYPPNRKTNPGAFYYGGPNPIQDATGDWAFYNPIAPLYPDGFRFFFRFLFLAADGAVSFPYYLYADSFF